MKRKYSTKRMFTEKELVYIYARVQGFASTNTQIPWMQITRELGRLSYQSTLNAYNTLLKYLDNPTPGLIVYKTFKKAALAIKQMPDPTQKNEPAVKPEEEKREVEEVEKPVKERSADKLVVLQEAVDYLQECIVDYIVDEVAKRPNEALVQKERELEEAKKTMEEKIARLETIIQEAKDKSLIGMLKRRMTDVTR